MDDFPADIPIDERLLSLDGHLRDFWSMQSGPAAVGPRSVQRVSKFDDTLDAASRLAYEALASGPLIPQRLVRSERADATDDGIVEPKSTLTPSMTGRSIAFVAAGVAAVLLLAAFVASHKKSGSRGGRK